ncbi:MAG TPA: class I SAM-dependent methyltransferase [Actinocrinis sp.]|uniref:class I SAM-dependent DNA methyltransferase n=1 Tax=Actinocrinis sp. TaxID=1920516 RepID=UPI002DDD4C26|nr:class I SAM-dependent methyltransferase [Actinocrinis sp.]HEV2346978.1 class I SAM-dependent methyltransferase [Actinocrinis sp.]
MNEPDFVRTTRASYDTIADGYAELVRGELAAKPLERALLAAFAELVHTESRGPVADVGCGTGRVTAHLHELGVPVFGIDLSPGMIAVARREHPGLRFEVGSMLALDLPDGEAGGVLAWYSTTHVPDDRLPGTFAEFHRVLAPGGHLLLAFQVGDDVLHLTEAVGHTVDLDFRRRAPEHVARLLDGAGFVTRSRTWRERDLDGPFPERTAQAFVLARKPPAAA